VPALVLGQAQTLAGALVLVLVRAQARVRVQVRALARVPGLAWAP